MRILSLILLLALLVAAPALAGDVAATLGGGTLALVGGDDGDTLTLATAGDAVRVTPGAGTTLNGEANALDFVVTKDVKADLAGGDDAITFDAVVVPGKLTIETGDGRDVVTLSGTAVVKSAKSISAMARRESRSARPASATRSP